MAEEKKNILTYEGLKKLEDELSDLKVNRRREVAQKIKEAREQGDLSENAEYDAAKDEYFALYTTTGVNGYSDYVLPATAVADNSTEAGRKQNRRVEVYMYASEQMIKDANAEANK